MLAVAYALVYIVWGSTYLAIRYVVHELPAFTPAGLRFITAGAILLTYARFRGHAMPTAKQWRGSAVLGALLLLGGNGCVMWAEQHVPSGITALLVATEPFWIVGMQWLIGGLRPTLRMVAGLLLGLVGVVVLVGLPGQSSVDYRGAFVVVLGSLSWAIGSFWSNRLPKSALAESAFVSSGAQMLCGGLCLIIVGAVTGEPARIAQTHVSVTAIVAFWYLVVFGSIITFNAYVWLVRHEPPARVATYAFVNPVVAVLIGWLLADEPLSRATLVAAVTICFAVGLVVTSRSAPHSTG
ncbi:MAG: EamA family transporter [Clostridia bacterium]|nr:EamA family transporter [Deltaproteobacteria bacterium]